MYFFERVKNISRFSKPLSKKKRHTIPSKEEFYRVIERERARADRSGGLFSIVVFEADHRDKSKSYEHYLIEIISMRIRPTDDMGWFDNAKIGIALPNTPAHGAKKFADDICKKISDKIHPPTYEEYTYPFNNSGNLKDSSQDIFNEEMDRATGDVEKTSSKNMEVIRLLNNIKGIEQFLVPRTPFWKRGIDIVISLIGLILLAPVIILTAILIKIVSPGPVFFKQKRVGYLGKPFLCYKFRSMHVNSDESVHTDYLQKCIDNEKPLAKLDEIDTRIYPFGYIMRKTCLDEVPQLINVLKGEMSLVGPRPELYNIFPMYDQWCKKRFDAIPGMTGSWQTNGKNHTTFKDMMREDIDYIVKRSFLYDAKIILMTIPAVLKPIIHIEGSQDP